MNPEDIKKSKYYNLKLQCILNAEKVIVFETASGDHIPIRLCDLECVSPITPSEPPTLVGTTPKHDPCRRFRKGDKVRLIAHRGRIAYDEGLQYPPDDTVYIVEHDEMKNGVVSIYEQPECDFDAFDIHFSFLELVTPGEDLARFVLLHHEFEQFYEICWKDDDEPDGRTGRTRTLATYWYHLPPQTYSQKEARAAAEAECARLNEEYRKDQA